MSRSGIRIFNAAISQLQQQQGNLRKVNAAKEKTKQDRETFNLDKKTKQLELEKAKREGQMSEITLQAYKSQMDEYFKGKDTQIKGIEALQNESEHKIFGQIKNTGKIVEGVGGSLREQGYELSYDKKNNMFQANKPEQQKVSSVDKTLGELKVGRFKDSGGDYDISNRKEAEEYATTNLGPDWKRKFPNATRIMNKKYGPKEKEFKAAMNGNKDPNVALKFLVNSVGMERNAAIKWINENN